MSQTLAPLMNERPYTKDEETVLLYFFTNTDQNIYCAKETLSHQLWAFLVGQYSRSHLSLRDRFLKLFEDQKKAYEKGNIDADAYISRADLAQSIRNKDDHTLGYFEERASNFLKKWGVDYGHSSLKDADRVRFAIEGVSQLATKIIEAPFPCLGDFQEKSTRYLPFWRESLVFPKEMEQSKNSKEIIQYTKELVDSYNKHFENIVKALDENDVLDKQSFRSDSVYQKTLQAKAFDIARYLLPTNVATSLGAGFSTRTLETHLSYMLAHPLSEIRLIAKGMHKEALKLSPGLLRHVSEDTYANSQYTAATKAANKYLGLKNTTYKGIEDKNRVRILKADNLDNMIVASILFEWAKQSGSSYEDCAQAAANMSEQERKSIIDEALQDRGPHNRMPRALQHGTVLCEFLCDFGAYRDLQRHRASKQIWQWASSLHGYEIPEFFDLPGIEDFAKDYHEIMQKGQKLAQELQKNEPETMQYASALGHLTRTSFEMDPGQLAYVIELRTTPQGHQSYRRLFLELFKQIQQKAPLFAAHIRAGGDETVSRKAQEEKAEYKRKQLGIS